MTHSFDGTVTVKALPVASYVTKHCVFHEAVSVIGVFIEMDWVVAIPVYAPMPLPVQLVKTLRVFVPLVIVWVIAMLAVEPASYQPAPLGELYGELTVRQYCSCQLNVIMWLSCMLVKG